MDDLEKKRMLYALWAKQERRNLDLFIKRNLWVRPEEGPIVRFRPNGIQKAYAKMKDGLRKDGRPLRILVLKYRRGGISTWEQAESYHRCCSREGQYAITLAQDAQATEEIFSVSTLFYERMDPMRRPRRRALNKRELNFPDLRSKFYTGTAGTKGFARGTTLQRVHGSEVAQFPGGIFGTKQLLAGITQACRKGDVILESTANGMGNWFQVEFFKAMKKASPWTPIFLAWYMDGSNRVPLYPGEKVKPKDDEEAAVVKKYGLDTEQLKWRQLMKAELEDLFFQEYPEDWITAFVVSGSLFFTQTVLRDLMPRCRDPLAVEALRAAECPAGLLDCIQVWHPPAEGMKAFIGADCSEGIPGLDLSCGGVLDLEGRQCAAIHGYFRPEDFGQKLALLAHWYNDALLAVESNEHGHSVLNTLMNTVHYPHLYRHKDYDQRTGRPKLGWQTNPKTRPQMLDAIREATEQGFMEVNHQDFIAECFTFVKEAGKWQARQGSNDDTIFAWGISWKAREKGSRKVGYRELGDRPDMSPEEKDSEKELDGPGFIALKV